MKLYATILQLMQLYATYATILQLYETILQQFRLQLYATICNYATCNLCNLRNFMELMKLYTTLCNFT
jgi:hypothetical protein